MKSFATLTTLSHRFSVFYHKRAKLSSLFLNFVGKHIYGGFQAALLCKKAENTKPKPFFPFAEHVKDTYLYDLPTRFVIYV